MITHLHLARMGELPQFGSPIFFFRAFAQSEILMERLLRDAVRGSCNQFNRPAFLPWPVFLDWLAEEEGLRLASLAVIPEMGWESHKKARHFDLAFYLKISSAFDSACLVRIRRSLVATKESID